MLNEHEQRRERQRAPSALLEATVASPAIDDDSDFLRVELDGAPGVVHDCPYMPRGDDEPSPGDAAAVMESDGGNYWVVGWWPQ
jgi:hypothetical protein